MIAKETQKGGGSDRDDKEDFAQNQILRDAAMVSRIVGLGLVVSL